MNQSSMKTMFESIQIVLGQKNVQIFTSNENNTKKKNTYIFLLKMYFL